MTPSSKNYKDSALQRHTWLPSNGATIALAWCLCVLGFSHAFAQETEESGWFRYENDFFVAYSNATNRQARKILEDLEYFRAAALRVPDIEMPRYTDKTLVVIPATDDEYARLAENQNAIGFAQPLSNRTAIVFPASSRSEKSKYVLHHEYAHALAHGNLSEYPQWYMEGFAEVASSVVIHKRRKSFYVGMHEGRWHEANEPLVDWDDLISDDFDAHAFRDVKVTASAYAQYWLLAHFLTMSGRTEYLRNLERYFAMVEGGESSGAAFSKAFGLTAAELWEQELKDYLWHIPEYRHSFGQSTLDRSFDRVSAAQSEIQPMLKFFTDKASMARGMGSKSNPLAFLAGKWDQLKFTEQCTEILTFRLENGADMLVMDDFYTAGDGSQVPALFSVSHQYGNEMVLRNITKLQNPEISQTRNYQLSIRGEDVLCFDEVPATMLCQRVLHRCEE